MIKKNPQTITELLKAGENGMWVDILPCSHNNTQCAASGPEINLSRLTFSCWSAEEFSPLLDTPLSSLLPPHHLDPLQVPSPFQSDRQ